MSVSCALGSRHVVSTVGLLSRGGGGLESRDWADSHVTDLIITWLS